MTTEKHNLADYPRRLSPDLLRRAVEMRDSALFARVVVARDTNRTRILGLVEVAEGGREWFA